MWKRKAHVKKVLIVYHVYFCLNKTGDWRDIQRVANSHGGQTSYLQRIDLKILKPGCRVKTGFDHDGHLFDNHFFKRSNGYLTVVLLCQHNHLHAAFVLSVIHKSIFNPVKWRHIPLYTYSFSMLENIDTYAIMEAEPHSVVRSKSCMARSGQQWIMTRKWTSQRLRVSYSTEQFICTP